MAQGDATLFDDFVRRLALGEHDLLNDELRMILIDDTTTAAATDEEPNRDSYTQTTGDYNKENGILVANKTVTESAGDVTFDFDPVTFRKGANEPNDVYQLVLYNDSHPSRAAILFIDPTTDAGVTPYDLTANSLTWTPNASGVMTIEKG